MSPAVGVADPPAHRCENVGGREGGSRGHQRYKIQPWAVRVAVDGLMMRNRHVGRQTIYPNSCASINQDESAAIHLEYIMEVPHITVEVQQPS